MPKLWGSQKKVLQAISDLPKDAADSVMDTQIAQATDIAIKDVRDWLETLEEEGYVEVARTEAGLSASVTANGRLALGQFRPFSSSTPGPAPFPTTKPPLSPTGPSGTPSLASTELPDAQPTAPRPAIRLFYSYSHKDEELRKELEEHLSLLRRQGVISGWHDRMIGAGEEWKGQLDKNLEEAQIILLLISPSFLASDYCYDIETKRALERHDKDEATVIPVLLRPVDWEGAPFFRLQGLPIDLRPVTTWTNRDEAFMNIAQGIRRAIERMRNGTR
ncbi:MAG: toll/interleukin-1 receptor domain-containing protein [Isosphaeraceae bacterium]